MKRPNKKEGTLFRKSNLHLRKKGKHTSPHDEVFYKGCFTLWYGDIDSEEKTLMYDRSAGGKVVVEVQGRKNVALMMKLKKKLGIQSHLSSKI